MVAVIPFIEIGNTVLGVLGLGVGVIAIPYGARKGRQQIKQMGEMRNGLENAILDLKGDVETHYIGNFPDFIPRIVEILGEAREKITVFCDMPAYGVVSDPHGFKQYTKAIETKAKAGVEVRMLHLDGSGRAATRGIEFADSWGELGAQERVAAFLDAHRRELDGDPKSNFLALVESEQAETLEQFKEAGVQTSETGLIMPLYFWIIDGRKAVFALTEFSEEAHEAGFWTRSEKLISAMEGIFERYDDRQTEESRSDAPAAVA